MDHPIGVQSFTYREFTVDEICSEISNTDVTAIELCGLHIDPTADDSEIQNVKQKFKNIGVDICGFGVHDFEHPSEIKSIFEFCEKLGVEYLSVNFDPSDTEIVAELVEKAGKYDILVAIHNHGPEVEFSTVEDVNEVIEGESDVIGACVDIGHFFRSDQSPDAVIPALGDRVHAVHLKDFVDINTEVIPGDGQLNLEEFFDLLEQYTKFDTAMVIEYELDAENPTPAVAEICARLNEL